MKRARNQAATVTNVIRYQVGEYRVMEYQNSSTGTHQFDVYRGEECIGVAAGVLTGIALCDVDRAKRA